MQNSNNVHKHFDQDKKSLEHLRGIRLQTHISLRKNNLDTLLLSKRIGQMKYQSLLMIGEKSVNMINLKHEDIKCSDLGMYFNNLDTCSMEELIDNLRIIRKILSNAELHQEININDILNHPNYFIIFQIIENSLGNLQEQLSLLFEALWILSNSLYFCSFDFIQRCFDYYIFDVLLKIGLKFSQNPEIVEKIAWIVGNLVTNPVEGEIVLKNGLFGFLINVIMYYDFKYTELLTVCYWAVKNCICFQNHYSSFKVQVKDSHIIIKKLLDHAMLLNFEDREETINIWKIIDFLTNNQENLTEIMFLKENTCILTVIFNLLNGEYLHLILYNLRIIGNFVYFDNEIAQLFMQNNIMHKLKDLLLSDVKDSIK